MLFEEVLDGTLEVVFLVNFGPLLPLEVTQVLVDSILNSMRLFLDGFLGVVVGRVRLRVLCRHGRNYPISHWR